VADAHCEHCGHSFAAPPGSRGAIVNCPACGKAVQVEGEAPDALWLLIRVGIVAGALLIAWGLSSTAGPLVGIAVGALVIALALALTKLAG
jgi:uncharacterized paraquat-inducible protein A